MSTQVFSYQVLDGHGIRANTGIFVNVPDTTTIAQLRAAWIALGSLLDAATDGKVARGRITIPEPADATFKGSPSGPSDASMAGVLQFSLADTTYTQSVVIPALAETELTNGRVNLNADGLHDLIVGLMSGFGAGTAFTGVSNAGLDITGINNGFLGTRKHRKQASGKTSMSGSNFVP